MGGTSGEISGATKIETYLKYVEQCEKWDGSHHPDPKGKKWCKSQMVRDVQTGEWVLSYHFHT